MSVTLDSLAKAVVGWRLFALLAYWEALPYAVDFVASVLGA